MLTVPAELGSGPTLRSQGPEPQRHGELQRLPGGPGTHATTPPATRADAVIKVVHTGSRLL